jgi:hypothetical protein
MGKSGHRDIKHPIVGLGENRAAKVHSYEPEAIG